MTDRTYPRPRNALSLVFNPAVACDAEAPAVNLKGVPMRAVYTPNDSSGKSFFLIEMDTPGVNRWFILFLPSKNEGAYELPAQTGDKNKTVFYDDNGHTAGLLVRDGNDHATLVIGRDIVPVMRAPHNSNVHMLLQSFLQVPTFSAFRPVGLPQKSAP